MAPASSQNTIKAGPPQLNTATTLPGVEMIDGIPVDRRPTLNASDEGTLKGFLIAVMMGRRSINDFRLVYPSNLGKTTAEHAELILLYNKLLTGWRPDKVALKKLRKQVKHADNIASGRRWRN